MNGFDLVVAVIFVISIVVGVMRGFIKEALSITSWIMAVWLGLSFCHEAGEFIGQYVSIPAESFRTWAGFALVFVGTLFAFSLLSFIISKLLVQGPIKGTDRVLGVGFGALRAVAILILLILVARGFGLGTTDWWQQSKSMMYLEPMANYVETLLPEQLRSAPEMISDATGIGVSEDGDSDAAEIDSAAAVKAILEGATQ